MVNDRTRLVCQDCRRKIQEPGLAEYAVKAGGGFCGECLAGGDVDDVEGCVFCLEPDARRVTEKFASQLMGLPTCSRCLDRLQFISKYFNARHEKFLEARISVTPTAKIIAKAHGRPAKAVQKDIDELVEMGVLKPLTPRSQPRTGE